MQPPQSERRRVPRRGSSPIKREEFFDETEPTGGQIYFPVPCNDTVCGELVALSRTANLAVRKPTAVGLNVTLIVQLALAARLPPQVLLGEAKSPASAPVNVMLLIFSVAVPVFLSVTVFAALVTPTTTLPNAKDVGVSVTALLTIWPPRNVPVLPLWLLSPE